MNLTYSQYKEITDNELTYNGELITTVRRHLIPVIQIFTSGLCKNQKELVRITGEHFIDYSMTYVLNSFGITTEVLSSRTNYLFVVRPELNIREQISDLYNQIDEDAIPTDLIVLSNDIPTIERIYAEVLEEFPKINIGNLIPSKEISFIDTIAGGKLSAYEFYDVTDKLIAFSNKPRTDAKRLDEYCLMIDDIAKESEGKIITFSGDMQYQELYCIVVTELYNRYNVKFYMYKQYSRLLQQHIRESLYDNFTSTVYDKVMYLKNLPLVMLQVMSTSSAYHLIRNKNISISIDYTELESTGACDSYSKAFSINDIEVIQITSMYDINDLDEKFNELTNRIRSLYDIIKIPSTAIIDMTNLIVFRYEGVVYIGRVEDIFGDIDTICVHTILGRIESKLSLSECLDLLPVDMFLDGIKSAKMLLSKFGVPCTRETVIPYKSCRAGSTLLKTSRFSISSFKQDLTYVDNFTIGMNSINCLRLRAGFYNHLVDIIGIQSTRNQLDCFGGFHPKVNNILKLI